MHAAAAAGCVVDPSLPSLPFPGDIERHSNKCRAQVDGVCCTATQLKAGRGLRRTTLRGQTRGWVGRRRPKAGAKLKRTVGVSGCSALRRGCCLRSRRLPRAGVLLGVGSRARSVRITWIFVREFEGQQFLGRRLADLDPVDESRCCLPISGSIAGLVARSRRCSSMPLPVTNRLPVELPLDLDRFAVAANIRRLRRIACLVVGQAQLPAASDGGRSGPKDRTTYSMVSARHVELDAGVHETDAVRADDEGFALRCPLQSAPRP